MTCGVVFFFLIKNASCCASAGLVVVVFFIFQMPSDRFRSKGYLNKQCTPEIAKRNAGVSTEWQVCSKAQLLAWLGAYTSENIQKFESLKDGYVFSRAVAIAYQHSPGQIAVFMQSWTVVGTLLTATKMQSRHITDCDKDAHY